MPNFVFIIWICSENEYEYEFDSAYHAYKQAK